MKNFDLHRYGMLLRLEFVGAWRRNLMIMTGLFLGLFAIMLIKLTYHNFSSPEPYMRLSDRTVWGSILVPTLILWGISWLKGASMIMDNARTKQQFTARFTLPATAGEKFAARLTYLLAGQTLGFALCFVAADLLQGLVFCTMRDVPGLFTPLAVRSFSDTYVCGGEHSGFMLTLTVLSLLAGHGVYTLGGVAFRRWPFVLTTLCNWLLGIALFTFCFWIGNSFPDFIEALDDSLHDLKHSVDEHTAQILAKGLVLGWHLLVCLACYGLAYRIYRRRQLV